MPDREDGAPSAPAVVGAGAAATTGAADSVAPRYYGLAEAARLSGLPVETLLGLTAARSLLGKVVAGTTIVDATSLHALLQRAPEAAGGVRPVPTEPAHEPPRGLDAVAPRQVERPATRRYDAPGLTAWYRWLVAQPDAWQVGLEDAARGRTVRFAAVDGPDERDQHQAT